MRPLTAAIAALVVVLAATRLPLSPTLHAAADATAGGPTAPITITWSDHILTLHHPEIPGGKVETWYLEAYCRPGSTDREWDQTTIGHRTELLSANASKTELRLRCTLSDGVVVDHTIRAVADGVTFDLSAHNPTGEPSLAHWAQPCIRVGAFTGTGADATDDKYAYLARSFVFQDADDAPDFMPTPGWATEARYTPGQVWCPEDVPRADINPRPLHPDAPHLGLIGCVSADDRWILATAWSPYQELFQGVIRCLHSDFRIGGLAPGERKAIKGKIYLVPNAMPALLERYREEFTAGVGSE